ncbi:MAG: LCP family protein, partial [Actinomycetota bacterium]|nr:LCP family protein [Actinomycetota bacterium]
RGAVRGGGRRWPRRVLVATASVVLVLVLVGVGVLVYARYRFDQVHKAAVSGLVPSVAGHAFDVLLVGSDSRAFVGTPAQAAAFGSAASQTGHRSDVIVVARIDPASPGIRLLSIPRDTYVDIPGHVANVSGPNRINVAFDSGPSLLVATIEQSFHIPITYYAAVDFPGFAGMVDALGGVYLDFRYPVRDAYSGLDVSATGCQLVDGTQALALVRSRHLYYFEDGHWSYDGLSDLSRIRRQDAFFRSVVSRLRGAVTDPIALNRFLGAATRYVTIDKTLGEGELLSLARILHGLPSSALEAQTLPTAPVVVAGQDVLAPAPAPDERTIAAFLAFGSTGATTTPTGPSATHAAPAPRGVDARGTPSAPTPPAAPVTTVPGTPAVGAGGIDYNTQPEPWNPVPCAP